MHLQRGPDNATIQFLTLFILFVPLLSATENIKMGGEERGQGNLRGLDIRQTAAALE